MLKVSKIPQFFHESLFIQIKYNQIRDKLIL